MFEDSCIRRETVYSSAAPHEIAMFAYVWEELSDASVHMMRACLAFLGLAAAAYGLQLLTPVGRMVVVPNWEDDIYTRL
eukprot:7282459-Heterocapsa_arctica.AAC.1